MKSTTTASASGGSAAVIDDRHHAPLWNGSHLRRDELAHRGSLGSSDIMLGGRAFPKPFPIMLGTNGNMIDYLRTDTTGLATAQSIGMKVWREEVPWNFTKPGGARTFSGLETVPGTRSTTNAATVASSVASIKAAGLRPLLVVTVNNTPGLSSTWTSGIPCTPAQFSATMAWLVAQPGLQGLDWELFNEPDGSGWGITAALLTSAYQLAYPAMKSADPTCVIHSSPTQNIAPSGYSGQGTPYWDACVTAGILTGNGSGGKCYDILDFHQYSQSARTYHADCAPNLASLYPSPMHGLIANFRAHMIANGDTSDMWMTECGWQSTGEGQMTPALCKQFYQDFVVSLSGQDTRNGVPFSSYLKVFCQYAMNANGAHWGIVGTPVAAVLAQLVKGS